MSSDAKRISSMMLRTSVTHQPMAIRTISKHLSNLGMALALFAHWNLPVERKSIKRICLQILNFMIEAGKRAH